jgi:Fic family protein
LTKSAARGERPRSQDPRGVRRPEWAADPSERGSRAPWRECEHLLYRLCEWLNGPDFDRADGDDWKIPLAVIRAIVAHLYIEWIHPFSDGNGRTGRLVEYQLLAEAGIPEVACHLLSNHYNDNRTEYYRQQERASASSGDILPFIHYAIRGFVDGLSEHLQTVREQQWDISWVNYVHEKMQKWHTRSRDRIET